MVLPKVDLGLGQLLRSGSIEMCQRPLLAYLPLHQSISPNNSQSIMTLPISRIRAPLKPHPRHDRIHTHTFPSQVHPPQIPCAGSGVAYLHTFLPRRHRGVGKGVGRVTRPHGARDLFEIMAGALKAAWNAAYAFATRCNPAWGLINTSLIIDLA